MCTCMTVKQTILNLTILILADNTHGNFIDVSILGLECYQCDHQVTDFTACNQTMTCQAGEVRY